MPNLQDTVNKITLKHGAWCLSSTYQFSQENGPDFYKQVRDSVHPQQIVINVAVTQRLYGGGTDCDKDKCSKCGNENAQMKVRNVEVWQKINSNKH